MIVTSYSVHLWTVTGIYCLVLVRSIFLSSKRARPHTFIQPFQVWDTLKWLTIPSTVIVSFVFFGFLVAGEEIESTPASTPALSSRSPPRPPDPFGYDKNDLVRTLPVSPRSLRR